MAPRLGDDDAAPGDFAIGRQQFHPRQCLVFRDPAPEASRRREWDKNQWDIKEAGESKSERERWGKWRRSERRHLFNR